MEKKSSSLIIKYSILLGKQDLPLVLIELGVSPINSGLFFYALKWIGYLVTVIMGVSIFIDSKKFQLGFVRLLILSLISAPIGLTFFYIDYLIREK